MSSTTLPSRTSVQFGPSVPTLPDPVGADAAEGGQVYAEQITEIARRLEQRYPTTQISVDDLEARVRGFHHQFDTVRIRTFVAVFVERLVRRSIDQPVAGLPAGTDRPQG